MMTMTTLNTIKTMLTAVDFAEKDAVMTALDAELELAQTAEERKMQAKATKLAEYADAHEVVMQLLRDEGVPLTVAEIWGQCEGVLEGFSKGKLSYALSHLWVDEVEKTTGKVNSYALKA